MVWGGRHSRRAVMLCVVLSVVAPLAGCESERTVYVPADVSADSAQSMARAAVNTLVDGGAPGAVAEVSDGPAVSTAAAGVRRLRGPQANVGDPLRVAQVTESMVATVILQLVADGSLTLKSTTDDLLPGVLPRSVTVEQLLEHTSGLPDYTTVLAPPTVGGITRNIGLRRTPDELVAAALTTSRQPAADGTTMSSGVARETVGYSATDYILLGLIANSVSGKTMAELLQEKVFDPAGMRSTSFPDDSQLPATALRGYLRTPTGLRDVSAFPATFWSSAGAVVSTVGDVNRFYRALFGGALLRGEQLRQMQVASATSFGMGLQAADDPCSSSSTDVVLGQRGDGFGYRTISYSSPDGRRQATLSWTVSSPAPGTDPLTSRAVNAVRAMLGATCST